MGLFPRYPPSIKAMAIEHLSKDGLSTYPLETNKPNRGTTLALALALDTCLRVCSLRGIGLVDWLPSKGSFARKTVFGVLGFVYGRTTRAHLAWA